MIVVPDASVILKWVLPSEREDYGLQARRVRDAYLNGNQEMLLPALWLFEVGNILALKFPQHAANQLQMLCDLDVPSVEASPEWRSITFGLVETFGVTFYDVSYHATALISQGVRVTADKRYLRKAASAGNTLFLGDWQ